MNSFPLNMQCPAPPVSLVLDKSHLFVHLPSDPQNETRRYLECAATGHLYCMSTGSLLWKKVPNITPLLPYNPASCTIKTSFATATNTDQQYNGASASLSIESKVKGVTQSTQDDSALIHMSNIESKTSPKGKDVNQHTQGGSARIPPSITESKTSPKVTEPTQGDSALIPPSSTESITSPTVKDVAQPTQVDWNYVARRYRVKNPHQQTLNTQYNRTLEVKYGDQPNQGDSVSGIQNISSKVKNNQTPSVNSTDKPVQCIGVSSISKTTYKVKQAGQSVQGNHVSIFSYPQCNKNAILNKAISGNNKSRIPKAPRSKASRNKSDTSSQADIPTQNAIPFYASHNSNFEKTTKKKRKKRIRKSKNKSNPKTQTTKQKTSGPMYHTYKNIWAVLKPFNRRPHPRRDRQKSLLNNQCKNCIMASSVHEIIHSPFVKNKNELMPDSHIRALLNTGDRKLRTRKQWIQSMEEEAIHKYKKLSLENHDKRLQVKEYDVLHHPEKSWLVSYGRWVIDRKNKESWPLLVKCLHKYPDSTLRKASKHRSFCLRWNGTSYTLRMDHAYYTQIQCYMAITDTAYAELIVHTCKETTFLPVYFDSDFWKQTEEALETFFTNNILPYLKKNKIESNPISVPLNSENSNFLDDKEEDEENRARRDNLRIRGLPESIKDLQSTVTALFQELCPNIPIERLEMDRVHRALYIHKSGASPGDIVIKLHFHSTRKQLLQVARSLPKLVFQGHEYQLYPDLAPSTLAKRRALKPYLEVLQQKQIQYRWGFPFKLLFSCQGKLHTILTPEGAQSCFESLQLLQEYPRQRVPNPSVSPTPESNHNGNP